MSNADLRFITDMLRYARIAHGKIAGVTRDHFEADDTLQFALAYLILVVGEAASRLSREAQAQLPDLPWSDMIGMRHRLVHGYGAVSRTVVWDVATNDLPDLITALEKFTPPEPPSA